MKYISIIILLLYGGQLKGQTTMVLRQAQIFGGSPYDQVVAMGTFYGPLIWGNIFPLQFRVTGPTFLNNSRNTFATFNSQNISMQIQDIGGTTPGSAAFQGTLAPVHALSTSTMDLFTPLSALANRPNGIINMRWTIPGSPITNTTWTQGAYLNTRQYTTYNITTPATPYISPATESLFLEVDAILNWQTPPAYISNNMPPAIFDLFRNTQGLNLTVEGTLGTTMPFELYLMSTANSILKNGTAANPAIPLSSVLVGGMDVSSGTSFLQAPLSTTDRQLVTGFSFPIATRNRNPIRYTLNIPQNQLMLYYFRPGTYSIPALRLRSTATAIATRWNEAGGLKTMDNNLAAYSFTVPEQQQIHNDGDNKIAFNYNSTASFNDGSALAVTRQLNISSNIDYSVYVKSESPAFQSSGSATIPLNVLQISTTGIGTEGRTISLSNSAQLIIAASPPVLDRKVPVTYSISPANARQKIFGVPSGNYSTNVIYSFIAN